MNQPGTNRDLVGAGGGGGLGFQHLR